MTISAWFMDADVDSDQRLPHLPDDCVSVTTEELTKLGVLSWTGLEGAGPAEVSVTFKFGALHLIGS